MYMYYCTLFSPTIECIYKILQQLNATQEMPRGRCVHRVHRGLGPSLFAMYISCHI